MNILRPGFEIRRMMRKRFMSCQRDDAGGLMKYRRSAQYCAAPSGEFDAAKTRKPEGSTS
jgi:hypothetical protein